ncbi:MAG TPA: hypothetical protein VGM05_09440, partial [Planctomycetaceae bacterium]
MKLSDGDPEHRPQFRRVQFLTLPVRRVSGIAIKHVPRVGCEIFSFLDYQQSNGFEDPVEMELHRGAGRVRIPNLEPVDDGAVLSQHGFQMAGNRKGQASDAIELRFRAIYDAPYASRRPKFADHAVESLIALIKSVIVQIRCQTILFMHVEV